MSKLIKSVSGNISGNIIDSVLFYNKINLVMNDKIWFITGHLEMYNLDLSNVNNSTNLNNNRYGLDINNKSFKEYKKSYNE